ncbi:MAG TPA: hypothetical protein VKW04_05620 [Planctomycetota bacterium]|nr:hypothetical protein [Planctomycetota bacterium]
MTSLGRPIQTLARGVCDYCANAIPWEDFDEQVAAVVAGKSCCRVCMEEGLWVGSEGSPDRRTALRRRTQARYLPSHQCDLILRFSGIRGLLQENLLVTWLDVSEGGLRAMVRRRCEEGDCLSARILHRPQKRAYKTAFLIRHAEPSRRREAVWVVGGEFDQPPSGLGAWIREIHGGHPALEPPADRR